MSRSASPEGLPRSRSRSPPDKSPQSDRVREAVEASPRRSRSRSKSPPKEKVSLFVSGLAARVIDADLFDHFREAGKLKEARVVLDPRTRDSRGFGFVDYDDPRDADNAVRKLDRSVLKGRVITIEKAKRGRPRTPTPGGYQGSRTQRDLPPMRFDRYERPARYDRYERYDRRRSPSPAYYRRRSPPAYRRRSPSPYRRRSPSPYRRRSPSPYRRRSPSPYRRRSLSPY